MLHHSIVIDGGDADRVELYLPTLIKFEIDQQKKLEREQRMAEERERELRQQKEREERKGFKDVSMPATGLADAASALELSTPSVTAAQGYDPRLMHPVYALAAAQRLIDNAAQAGVDRDTRKRDEALAKKMLEAGILRKIAVPANAAAELDALRQGMPHFGEVIDLVRGRLVLVSQSLCGPRIPPILLTGEPGLGKTHFAGELARILGTTVRRMAFDGPVTGATLMGSDRRWGNTSHGALFDLICLGEHANPIVILDEIDKVSSRRRYDPLGPLHTLLEPSTAAHARDISVDFEFDASQITWIATANDTRPIPAPLLSRFTQFAIQRPGAEGAIESAQAVMGQAFVQMALENFEPPHRRLAVALAHLTAREIRQATEQAIAAAVGQGRRAVTLSDVPTRFRDEASGKSAPSGWLH
jgi:ATP-dependent Lon protease